MKPREEAEGGAAKRSARGDEDGRNAVRIAEGAASAASTFRRATGPGTGLIEQMIDSENLNLAWRKVKTNKGAAGVDGLGIEQTATHLRSQRQRIEAQLLAGTYKPQPVRRVEIPKASGGTRKLGVPTVMDRWIQQALLQVLGPLFETGFCAHSYGFRPGRSAHQAVLAAREHQRQGKRWVVDLDQELVARGHAFCRYADDCNIYVATKRSGERVMASVIGFLEERKKLKVNREKSAVDEPIYRVFLGYGYMKDARVRIRVPEKTCTMMRGKLKELFSMGRGRNLESFMRKDLNLVPRGWMNYSRLSETKRFAVELDGWIRRRLRCVLWTQ